MLEIQFLGYCVLLIEALHLDMVKSIRSLFCICAAQASRIRFFILILGEKYFPCAEDDKNVLLCFTFLTVCFLEEGICFCFVFLK